MPGLASPDTQTSPQQDDPNPVIPTTKEIPLNQILSEQEKFTTVVMGVNKYVSGVSNNNLTPEDLQTISRDIKENFDVLKTSLVSGDKFVGAVHMLKEIRRFHLIPELSQMANSAFESYVQNYAGNITANPDILHNTSFDIKKTAFVFSVLLNGMQYQERQVAWNLLQREFARWGGTSSDFLSAWSASKPEVLVNGLTGFGGIVENLPTAIAIESQRPGIIKILSKEFGIRDFGRYPEGLLIRQYDERDNQNKPYGVILYPRNDWNGAFLHNQRVFGQLYDQLEEKFSIRIIEAQSKNDIARALINLRKRYPSRKISFAVIGGHGNKGSIRFGGGDQKHLLAFHDLMGKGVKRSSEFFEPNPSIILASCSTGAEGGIGQQLSQIMGAKVIAPEIPSAISSIKSEIDPEGKVMFDVDYWEKETAKHYSAGQKQNL